MVEEWEMPSYEVWGVFGECGGSQLMNKKIVVRRNEGEEKT